MVAIPIYASFYRQFSANRASSLNGRLVHFVRYQRNNAALSMPNHDSAGSPGISRRLTHMALRTLRMLHSQFRSCKMSGYNKRLGGEIMPTAASVMADLKKKGTDKMRRMYVRHGMAAGNAFGVSMADLKLIAKSIKGQRALACELYETGNLDAMYLAGMVADGSQMTKKQLNQWADGAANLQMISEYTVP